MNTNAGPQAARLISAVGLSLSGLGVCLALAGCFGYVEGPGSDVVLEPDLILFGGYYQGGEPARDYGRRGAESRGVVARFGRGRRPERRR